MGQNNTGKTGLLEALVILLKDPPQIAANLPNIFRSRGGDTTENFWKWIYYDKDTNNTVEIQAKFDSSSEFGVSLGTATSTQGPWLRTGNPGNMSVFTLGQREKPPLGASTFSTHPTNPKQDAIGYNRDEIENGLHHSVLPTIWRGLFHAAEEVDVQIFATTHSWECVLAADQATREEPNYDLNLIRLDRMDDNIKATIIDRDAINTAKELHWEMR